LTFESQRDKITTKKTTKAENKMNKYKLNLKYVYTFYNNGEIEIEDVFDENEKILNTPHRFTLHDQEDGSFILSELLSDFKGKYVTLTYPNKDILLIHENESVELEYDEYFSSFGDDNHNVYIGSLKLICE
jgi:hypothetical protein